MDVKRGGEMPDRFKRLSNYKSKTYYVSDCWDMLKRYAMENNKPLKRKHYIRLYHMEYGKLVKFHHFLLLKLAHYKEVQNV